MPANDDDTHVAEDLLDMLKLFLLSVNVLLFVAAAVVFATSPKRPASDATATAGDGAVPAVKHALLVTAHPDDESMFFLPLLHSLAQQSNGTPDWEVHLLCLSRGNFDGLGDIREQEMVTCGEFLGMKKANIRVLEDAKLQDGMQAQWDHAHIAQLVLAYIETHAIKAVRLVLLESSCGEFGSMGSNAVLCLSRCSRSMTMACLVMPTTSPSTMA